ncbi:MAG: hypothetical protein ABIL25_03675 [candidate division WOR-3 bacterium]
MKAVLVLFAVVTAGYTGLYHVDQPVPVSLAHGEYNVGVRLWGSGGALLRFGVGLFDRLTLGASFGGDSLIGSHQPAFYPRPEFFARGAILAEQGYFPDLVVGFESQGFDHFLDDEYEVYPKGGYVCLGKTVEPTRTYVEIGVNYWRRVSGFAVVNQLLPGGFEVIAEYDLAVNDSRLEHRRGYLNLGLGWTFNEQVRFGIGLRDVLGSRSDMKLNRVVDISFQNRF